MFVLKVSPHSSVPSEFYEYHALMMEEEGAVIVGLLVGLNVIDANLCVKGEDLDSQVRVVGRADPCLPCAQLSLGPRSSKLYPALLVTGAEFLCMLC